MKTTAHVRGSQDDTSPGAAMDVSDALDRLGNDEELFREIAQIYLEDAPPMLEKIHAAAGSDDMKALQRGAHSLRGLAANLSAHDVVGAAARLEHFAAGRNMVEVAQAVAEVDQRVSELTEAVQQYLRQK